MKKLNNKKLLYIFTICILVLVPFIKTLSYYLMNYKIISNYDFINPAIVLYISIPFLILIYIRNLIKTDFNLDKHDYLFYIILIAGIISSIFSNDIYVSIFGKSYRHEGLLSIISYNLLFINWKRLGNIEDCKKLLKLILWIAIANTIYGFFQVYTDFPFVIRGGAEGSITGFCGHNNFYGSLVITVLSFVSTKFLYDKKFNILDAFIIILLFIGLIDCQSSGPFLTYFIVLLFLFIFLYIKKEIKIYKIFVLILLLILTYIPITIINNKFGIRCETCNLKENTFDNGGNYRTLIWKNSLVIARDHFLIGVGFDNFIDYYPNPKIDDKISFTISTTGLLEKQQNTKKYYIVDNAHNVYLQTLISTGIIGLIPYLLICLFTFIKGLKSQDKVTFILLGGFVAYSIQAFANISVIQVAPIYYIIMGLILCRK